jgi:hypothetical protein
MPIEVEEDSRRQPFSFHFLNRGLGVEYSDETAQEIGKWMKTNEQWVGG